MGGSARKHFSSLFFTCFERKSFIKENTVQGHCRFSQVNPFAPHNQRAGQELGPGASRLSPHNNQQPARVQARWRDGKTDIMATALAGRAVDPASLPAAGVVTRTHTYYPTKTYRDKEMRRKDVDVSVWGSLVVSACQG